MLAQEQIVNDAAIMRSFDNTELEILRCALQAIVDGRPMTAEEYAMYARWHDNGGPAARRASRAGAAGVVATFRVALWSIPLS